MSVLQDQEHGEEPQPTSFAFEPLELKNLVVRHLGFEPTGKPCGDDFPLQRAAEQKLEGVDILDWIVQWAGELLCRHQMRVYWGKLRECIQNDQNPIISSTSDGGHAAGFVDSEAYSEVLKQQFPQLRSTWWPTEFISQQSTELAAIMNQCSLETFRAAVEKVKQSFQDDAQSEQMPHRAWLYWNFPPTAEETKSRDLHTSIYNQVKEARKATTMDSVAVNCATALEQLKSRLDDVDTTLASFDGNADISLQTRLAAESVCIIALRSAMQDFADTLQRLLRSVELSQLFEGEALQDTLIVNLHRFITTVETAFIDMKDRPLNILHIYFAIETKIMEFGKALMVGCGLPGRAGELYFNVGESQHVLGNFEKALETFRQVLEWFNQDNEQMETMLDEPAGNNGTEATHDRARQICLFNLFKSMAECEYNLEHVRESYEHYIALEKIPVSLLPEAERLSHRPVALMNLGKASLRLGRWDEAVRWYSQVLECCLELDDPLHFIIVFRTRRALGNIYSKLVHQEFQRQDLRKTLETVGFAIGEYDKAKEIAVNFGNRGDLITDIQSSINKVALFQMISQALPALPEAKRKSLMAERLDILSVATESTDTNDYDELRILYGRALVSILRCKLYSQPFVDTVLQKGLFIEKRLYAQFDKSLFESGCWYPNPVIGSLHVDILVHRKQIEEALVLSEKYRHLEALGKDSESDDVLNSYAAHIQQYREDAQSEGAYIVVYWGGGSRTYDDHDSPLHCWIIPPSPGEPIQFRFIKVQKTLKKTLQSVIFSFGNSLLRGNSGSADDNKEDCLNSLSQLYNVLIRPIEGYLQSEGGRLSKRLIIVPSGNLATVPFAALFDKPKNQYLLERYAVSISTSLKSLHQTIRQAMSQPPAQTILRSLVVGNPIIPPYHEFKFPLRYDNLHHAEIEAMMVHGLFSLASSKSSDQQASVTSSNVLLTRATATKTMVVESIISADYVHFACHGTVDSLDVFEPIGEGNTLRGALVLSPEKHSVQEFKPFQDLLWAKEICNLPLSNVKQVVLSACGTGKGWNTMEGVNGFTKAFRDAGVPRVVVSLWNVSDLWSKKIMVEYWKVVLFDREMDYATALQRAMLTVMEECRSEPELWAPFVFVGCGSR
ncbi:CHAT domain-containing protein [Jimgerdemannia flammicorona]|uniref:CHAT domain-containing protein n=1 Tax=Jimgerdemannia flammicorona TaxID=994334 RepID=A0A433QV71_9FUNG|nr:CHAT domain-containing protein [Jimgerdemannia flammicorona]